MNNFLEQVYFDNTLRIYFIVGGIILLVLLLKRFISRYIAGLLFNLVQGKRKKIDKKTFIDLVVYPLGIFVMIFISVVSLHKLVFPHLLIFELYNVTTPELLHSIGSIAIIFSFIWFLLRTIDFIAIVLHQKANITPEQTDNQLIVFFKDFFKVVIAIIGILMVLHFAFNLRIGNLLTGLSIIGAAIALALRESIENLIASFIIFFDKPFSTGDVVKVQNVTGNVERIGLRSTRLRTEQKTYVTVPNKQMVDTIVDNISLRNQYRGLLNLNVSLCVSSEKIEELIKSIRLLLDRPDVVNQSVILNDISPQAYILTVEFFTGDNSFSEFTAIKQEVNMKIVKLFEDLNIEMAGTNPRIKVTEQK